MKDNLVYNWLREKAEDRGWVAKTSINISEISRDVGITRKTVSTKFKKLLEDEVIIFNKELDRYELVNSQKDSFLFYKEYLDVIESIEYDDLRLKVIFAIIDYGLNGRYDKSDKDISRYMYIIEKITKEKRAKWKEEEG